MGLFIPHHIRYLEAASKNAYRLFSRPSALLSSVFLAVRGVQYRFFPGITYGDHTKHSAQRVAKKKEGTRVGGDAFYVLSQLCWKLLFSLLFSYS